MKPIFLLAVPAAALIFAGCSSSTPVSSDPSGGPAQPTAQASPPDTTPMGGSVTFSDGIVLGTSAPAAFKASKYAAAEPGRQFVTTMTATNNSQENYVPSSDVYTTASAGGVECGRIFDSEKKIEIEPSTPVLPGRSVSWKAAWACEAPAGAELVLAAKSNVLGDSAVFVGTLP